MATFKTYAEVLGPDYIAARAFEAGITKCPPRLTLGDVLQRTGGAYETTLPLSPRFRDRIREVAELSGDEHLLRIAELEEVRISLEKFRDLDPQTRIIISCRLEPHAGGERAAAARRASARPQEHAVQRRLHDAGRRRVHHPGSMTVSDAWILALAQQASMIRRYIIWRNNHAYHEGLHRVVDRANVA